VVCQDWFEGVLKYLKNGFWRFEYPLKSILTDS